MIDPSDDSGGGGTPPRIPEWLLTLVLRDPRVREDVLGDLYAEYQKYERGTRVPGLRYWIAALDVGLRFVLLRRPPHSLVRGARPGLGGNKARLIDSLLLDLQFALRTFRKSPGFATVAVLTLALGIGGSATIFTVVNSVILKPLPYPESARLVWITVSTNVFNISGARMGISPGIYSQIQTMPDVVKDVAIYGRRLQRTTLTGGGKPERVVSQRGSHDLFDVLGVRPIAGRSFLPSDAAPGTDERSVVMLSHGFWSRRYGSDLSIIGRTILLDDQRHEVIGVMPRGFAFPSPEIDIWTLARVGTGYGGYGWRGVARLQSGISIDEAEIRLNAIVSRLPEAFPGSQPAQMVIGREIRLHADPLKDTIVPVGVRQALWVVFGALAFVLLMACANVANLFLVRAEARRREIAVRTAVGAGRGRLARHFVAEGTGLASVGGLLGLGLAMAAVRVILRFGPVELPRLHEVAVDTTVVAFTAVVVLLSGGLFGAIALGHSRSGVLFALKGKTPGRGAGRSGFRIRDVLVVGQVAFALVLLVGSGLMIRSFWYLTQVDPGFDPTNVLTFEVRLDSDYPTREEQVAFNDELIDRLGSLPGVESVAAATCIPLRGRCPGGTNLREKDVAVHENPPPIIPSARGKVSSGYFEMMRIPLLAGRLFEPGPGDSLSVLLSATLARDRWPGENPIGRLVDLGNWTNPQPPRWYTVVGVIGDLPVDNQLMTRGSALSRVTYFPVSAPDVGVGTMTFVMRIATPPLGLVDAVRGTVRSMNPNLPVDRVQTMEEYVRTARAPLAFIMVLLVIGGVAALLLGVIGIHGVIAYTVGRRTNEIGIRMALGARAADVSRMVLREGGSVAVLGVLVGLAGAFALTRVMDSVVFGVSPTDPVTYISASVGLLVIALLATYLPARRAAEVDPLEALRAD